MTKKFKLNGALQRYAEWPILLSILLALPTAATLILNPRHSFIPLVTWLVLVIFSIFIYIYSRTALKRELINFATQYGQVQRDLLKGLAIPYALLDETGRFLWSNAGFSAIIHKDRFYSKSISSFFPEITRDKLPTDENTVSLDLNYENRIYQVDMRKISMKPDNNDGGFEGSLITVFLFDETDMRMYIRLRQEQSLVAGLIYIDNYSEALESVEDVRRSLLMALIDRKINKYFQAYDAIVKKLEKDKYFVIMKRVSFDKMQETRFDILEDVKTVSIGNEMAITLSIGFGLESDSFLQDNLYAKNAIDLALGRGGDQAVVKTNEKVEYFGGKSQQVERNTRVKARVKAHALKEIIESKEQILVMGHKNTDIDSFGAAMGIYRAATECETRCHVVINEVTPSIKPFADGVIEDPAYDTDVFVTSSEAIQICEMTSAAVIVVDTNKPKITECPELLEIAKTIVVLDHHRISPDRITNATLSYVESYASSACEMVSEILQYISDDVKIKPIEADCLYAGIMIDTNNFMTKTGVRTFEAAAFLRRNGANITRVRKLFRNDLEDFQARAEAVQSAELYKGGYAISQSPGNIESPTVTAAQAANELLNINLVKASFVLTEYQNRIFISARSIDEVNVQIIMERLGGGGHMNIAGAQIDGHTIEEAREMLKTTIDEMIEEGALN
ncbi:MAG: DHH family phosphoesterase [Lachnospiraceae bacterium]|nr:DHH family phosphoesterase [Lachnospiraceae bacterium]MDN4741991.1 DHH family phosphoesterase [Lachnospiraceae bacterium C1.1]